MPPSALLALLISGGPTPEYNQYAIESNARYVEKLTQTAQYQRVRFAGGSKSAKTISTLQNGPDYPSQAVFSWIYDDILPAAKTVWKAPTLKRLDGPATKTGILQATRAFVQSAAPGKKGLLYFTGHGSPGEDEDTQNTLFSTWNDGELSVTDLAPTLQKWPQNAPLTLVMVQCHAGGFSNLLFEGGDQKNPIWNRDFAGFFAATGDRQAAGCTDEVDEQNYQDFTTHFFAALSGTSRDGRPVSGADYDHNGTVSGLEALAWTNLNDRSIDVPNCTSDAYLRSLLPEIETKWLATPFSKITADAAPWQRAILDGLSTTFKLSGENRLQTAWNRHKTLQAKLDAGESVESDWPTEVNAAQTNARLDALQAVLERRFPGLRAKRGSKKWQTSRAAALKWLAGQKQLVAPLFASYGASNFLEINGETREAMLWRFLRAARTRVLEERLAQVGTTEQKAIFARLRSAEGRNPLK